MEFRGRTYTEMEFCERRNAKSSQNPIIMCMVVFGKQILWAKAHLLLVANGAEHQPFYDVFA